jgi:hypothetical protein
MLAVVDGDALLEVVWVSFVAAVGVTAAFSTLIAGVARAGLARREGRPAVAAAWFALGAAAGAICLGAMAAGLLIMLNK